MLNVHISYKPLSYWRILFWSGVRTMQFNNIKNFRALVVPVRVFRKGKILQGILMPTGLIPNEQ